MGTIVSGSISVGDNIVVLPSQEKSKIKTIISSEIKELHPKIYNKNIETINNAFSSMAITITLNDEIDISRGDIIVKADELQPEITKNIISMIVWMDEKPLELNKRYIIKRTSKMINAKFTSIKYKQNIL
jgi:sulfate adenylyltransferase subunit 1